MGTYTPHISGALVPESSPGKGCNPPGICEQGMLLRAGSSLCRGGVMSAQVRGVCGKGGGSNGTDSK